jgi:hypothetical protein
VQPARFPPPEVAKTASSSRCLPCPLSGQPAAHTPPTCPAATCRAAPHTSLAVDAYYSTGHLTDSKPSLLNGQLCGWAMQCCMCVICAKTSGSTCLLSGQPAVRMPPTCPAATCRAAPHLFVSSSGRMWRCMTQHLPAAWAADHSYCLTSHLSYSIFFWQLSSTCIFVAGLCNAVCVQEARKSNALPCPLSGQPAAHILPAATCRAAPHTSPAAHLSLQQFGTCLLHGLSTIPTI